MTHRKGPDQTSVGRKDDLDAFLAMTQWWFGAVPDLTWGDALDFIVQALRGDTNLRPTVVQLLRLDRPARREAERALCRLLSVPWRRPEVRWRKTHHPDRGTDWPRTCLDRHLDVFTHYWIRESHSPLDDTVPAALAQLADRWARELDATGVVRFQDRSAQLREAVAKTDRTIRGRRANLTSDILHRIASAATEHWRDLQALRKGLGDQLSAVRSKAVSRVLDDLKIAILSHEMPLSAYAHLMETTVRLAIARHAHHAGWRVLPANGATEDLHLHHPSGPWGLTVTKKTMGKDAYRKVRVASGLAERDADTQDSQPDVWMRFWADQCPDVHVNVLADSKRNDKDTTLFRDGLRTAVYYQMAYAEEIGLRIEASRRTADVRPLFTLFFLQGSHLSDRTDTLAALRDVDEEHIPEIIAFNLSDAVRNPSDEEVMSLWFRAIEKQALKRLCLGAGASVSSSFSGAPSPHLSTAADPISEPPPHPT